MFKVQCRGLQMVGQTFQSAALATFLGRQECLPHFIERCQPGHARAGRFPLETVFTAALPLG
jgi:hypothetical protein